ncbi:MAG TPA: NAD(P)-dependent oxidoreductase [Dehalococcoidia bacterium]|nr:NAD(P)-dependent oxidoreductase [Dehalococcoidia bacterium]
MTVLVTGGCGLVGSFAVRHAVEQGQRVIAFDLALRTELIQDILGSVTLVKGDVLEAPELMRAVPEHKVDRILHTASFLTPGAYERPYPAIETTIMGTLNVLECARIFNLSRVAYVSTGKTMLTGRSFTQSLSMGQLDIEADPYTSAKLAAELICNDYRKLYNLDVLVLRLSGQVFGPGYAFAGALGQGLQDLVEKPLRGEPVNLESGYLAYSRNVLPMLYAGDAGRGLMMATLAPKLKDYVFNIAGKENATLWEIADVMHDLVPDASIQVPRGEESGGLAEHDPRAQEQFGYLPEYDTRSGLREYINFLQSGRYQRLSSQS